MLLAIIFFSLKNLSKICSVWTLAGSKFNSKCFFNENKQNTAVILNDFKIMWGNLEILFLSWVIFNNVNLHNGLKFWLKWKIFQKKNINRKGLSQLFSYFSNFKLQQEVFKFNDICMSWSTPKNVLQTNFVKLGKSKFWGRHFLCMRNI